MTDTTSTEAAEQKLYHLFEDELRGYRRQDRERAAKIAEAEQEIARLKAQITAHKQTISQIEEERQQHKQMIDGLVNEHLNKAEDSAEEALLRNQLHHLIQVRTVSVMKYDEKLARAEVIRRRAWDYIRKPTLAIKPFENALRDGVIDWVPFETRQERQISFGDLGELDFDASGTPLPEPAPETAAVDEAESDEPEVQAAPLPHDPIPDAEEASD